jgi:hypothetical protein
MRRKRTPDWQEDKINEQNLALGGKSFLFFSEEVEDVAPDG